MQHPLKLFSFAAINSKKVILLIPTPPPPSLTNSPCRPHHVLGEQKQPGDGDVSGGGSGPPGRGRQLWGAASAAGHLGEQGHPEAAAVGQPVRHPRRGLSPGPAGGRVSALHSKLRRNSFKHGHIAAGNSNQK